MININELSGKFYDEIEKVISDPSVQILAEHTLYNVKQENLSFPRIIFGLIDYDTPDFDHTEEKYDAVKDVIVNKVEVIPRITMRFKIYSDDKTSKTIFDTLNKLHNYYTNRYIQKLGDLIVVVNSSSILPLLIDENDIATTGYEFTIDFDMSEVLANEYDYATSYEATLNVKY